MDLKIKKLVKMMNQVKMIKQMILMLRGLPGSWKNKVSPRLRHPRTWVHLILQRYSGQHKVMVNWGLPYITEEL
jgi:hypothetical protein